MKKLIGILLLLSIWAKLSYCQQFGDHMIVDSSATLQNPLKVTTTELLTGVARSSISYTTTAANSLLLNASSVIIGGGSAQSGYEATINGNSYIGGNIKITKDNPYLFLVDNNNSEIRMLAGDVAAYIYTNNAYPLIFDTNNGSGALFIDTNHNVGVGVTPSTRFTSKANSSGYAANFLNYAAGSDFLDLAIGLDGLGQTGNAASLIATGNATKGLDLHGYFGIDFFVQSTTVAVMDTSGNAWFLHNVSAESFTDRCEALVFGATETALDIISTLFATKDGKLDKDKLDSRLIKSETKTVTDAVIVNKKTGKNITVPIRVKSNTTTISGLIKNKELSINDVPKNFKESDYIIEKTSYDVEEKGRDIGLSISTAFQGITELDNKKVDRVELEELRKEFNTLKESIKQLQKISFDYDGDVYGYATYTNK